ncbi:MAG: DNRLRE domain-containing protein [Thermoplasmatales archaeon]|nr:DNRLRE domain-containing protein [Thermoplasmatales archaeon]
MKKIRPGFWVIAVFLVCLVMVFSSIQENSVKNNASNNTTSLTRGITKSPVSDVKIVYDSSYKTAHYSCWSGGYSNWQGTQYNDLNTVKNAGVVRRGKTFTVTGTGADISTKIIVKGPADPGRSRLTITNWNPTYWETTKWNLTIPSDAPVGDYQIYMGENYCTLYVIFDVYLTKTPSGMTDNEFASWAYTETAESGKYPCDYGLGDPDPSITHYHCFEERMTEIICSCMGSSTTTQFNASVNVYRLVNARLHWKGATTYPDTTTMLNAGTDANSKSVAALTVSEAKMVALQTGHTLPGNMIWATNCINHGNLVSALIRAMGIPSRPITMGDGSTAHSHVWEWGDFDTTGEAWIDEPDLTMSPTESKWIMFYPSDTSTSGTQNSNGEGEIDTEKNMYWHAYVLDTEPYTAIATENYVWRWKGVGNDPSAVAGWGSINMNSALTCTENDLPTFELSSATDYDYYTNWLAMGDRDFFRIHIPAGMTALDLGFVEGREYAQLYVRKNICVCSGANYATANGLKTGYTYDSWGNDRILSFAVTAGDYIYVMVDNAKEFQYARDYMGDSFGNSEVHRYVIGVGKCPPYANVISPNGDEHLIAGSSYDIKWNAGDVQTLGASPITIEYSTDPSHTTWTAINGGTYSKSNDGVEAWSVPSTASDTVKVRVTVTDTDGLTGSDSSDNDFKIKKTPEALNDVTSGTGTADNDRFGWNITSEDINNDGKDDIIVGAPYVDYTNTDCGAVYIFFGKASWNPNDLNAANADVTIYGSAANNVHFGWSVGNAGNVNGDVYNDIIVGEPDNGNGKAYVMKGRSNTDWGSATGNRITSVASTITLTGEGAGDKFGSSISGAGDVNNDNYDDVVVGAYGYGNDKGRAYIYCGDAAMDNIADYTFTGENDNNRFGFSVSSAGDINNDGYNDVIIGAPGFDGSRGKSYVYFGNKGGCINTVKNGALTANNVGWTESTSGTTSYTTMTLSFDSSTGNTLLGGSGPGCEKMVCADSSTTQPAVGNLDVMGRLTQDFCAPTGTYASIAWKFAWSVEKTGTFTGSYYVKYLIMNAADSSTVATCYASSGSSSASVLAWYEGSVAVSTLSAGTSYKLRIEFEVDNPTKADTFTLTLRVDDISLNFDTYCTRTGEASNNNFGFSVSDIGDINNDGIHDIIVGAPGYDNSKGRAYVHYGSLSLLGSDTLTITQQLGDTSEDHYIGKATSIITVDSNTNYGTNNMWLGYYSGAAPSGKERILLQFELSDISKDAVIIKSAVSVYEYSGSEGSIDVEAHRVIQMWDETKVTWNSYDGTNAWTTPGGDFDSSVEDIITIPDKTARWCTWDITQLTKKWVNGTYPNYGIMLRGTDAVEGSATSNDKWFRADDYTSDYTQRPKIEITLRYPADIAITGENTGDSFGYSVCSAGDVNNDGINDFVAGAPYNDNTASNAGAVYTFYGRNSMPKEINAGASDNITYGETLNDNFGFSVSSGNITGSRDDTITGSAYYGINDNGKAYVSTAQTLGPAGATAIATGPTGLTNNTGVTLIYDYTGSPTSVEIYYSKDGNVTWVSAVNDTTVNGLESYTITSGDGTYGWIAIAWGGGSTETPPTSGTPAESYGLTLDITPPTVDSTTPASSATNVPFNQNVVVVFNESMNISVTPTLSQTAGFDPSGWTFIGWSDTAVTNDTATWSHNNWNCSESVTMQVSAYKDKAGNTGEPYSWSFTVEPYWLNLTAGWNLVTITVDNATISNAEELVNIIGENCTAIAYWNTTLGRFVAHPAGSDISNFSIESGVGYMIYVTGDRRCPRIE